MSAGRFVLATVVVAGLFLVGLTLLPHDPYARFATAAAESPHYLRLRWIYERVHLDRTPIDVAFIGTSHTQSAIDSRIVEAELAKRGQSLHVVNFAVPHLGRDLHWLIVRELLEARSVRELVIEVQDLEPRAPHPAFQRVARADDLVKSPIVVNTGFFENLVRLPRRELDLFAPALDGRSPVAFDPGAYEGAHWDDTERLHGFDMTRDTIHPAAWLERWAGVLRHNVAERSALAARFAGPDGCSVLMRYNRHYLEAVLELAQEKGARVTFLYLPFFHGPDEPAEARFYQAYGPTLTPRVVLDDSTAWLNVDHLNVFGARRMSRWVGSNLPVEPSSARDAPHVSPCY